MHSKVWLNKFGENGYCRNYFIKKSFCRIFPVTQREQNYRECMETKKQYLGIPKNGYQVYFISVVNYELICLVCEGKSL